MWVFLAVSVCLFVRTIPSERLNIGWWNLAVRCVVQKSRPSSKVKVKGQGYQGQKNEKVRHFFSGAVLGGASCVIRQFLRRWENQRVLSSYAISYFISVIIKSSSSTVLLPSLFWHISSWCFDHSPVEYSLDAVKRTSCFAAEMVTVAFIRIMFIPSTISCQ